MRKQFVAGHGVSYMDNGKTVPSMPTVGDIVEVIPGQMFQMEIYEYDFLEWAREKGIKTHVSGQGEFVVYESPFKEESTSMKVFTCIDFKGFWPITTSAVVVAANAQDAAILLASRLKDMGLEQIIEAKHFVELDLTAPSCIILSDGNH